MEFEVRLFDTTSLAADGSNIPRRSCEEYLTSADYEVIIRDKVAVGGLSHKDRRLRPELKGIVGMDDQVFINENALFYITKLYFKEGSNFLYARAKTFDPNLFAGARRDNILNLIGMLKSGVRMPVSVVIQALWSKRGVAEKIIRIKGFDFTQNPSFKGAGDIKIFSTVLDSDGDMVKQFSSSEYDFVTREYSIDSEVVIDTINTQVSFSELINTYPNKESFSYSDIVRFYGIGSDQVKSVGDKAKEFKKEELDPTNDSYDNDYQIIKNYVDDDDQEALQLIFRSQRIKLMQILQSVPKDDPNHDQLVKEKINQFLWGEQDKSYSLDPNTVSDRVRTLNQPRYIKFYQTIRSYQKYWSSNKLDDNKKHKCKLLFLQDMNYLIKDVVSDIYKGSTLNSLYALNQYGNDITAAGIELSKTYRKVLISDKILKFIPKSLYGEWMIDARNFYQKLLIYTFGEGLPDIEFNLLKI